MSPSFLSEFDWATTWWESAIRLGAAAVCAGVIGWDREVSNRPAGLRTHIMVALGAATFTLVACALFETLQKSGSAVPADPARILGAIVGGIGFLGAGAIIQSGMQVRGLTTAASLWVIAAVGMACGVGYYSLAIMVTLMAFITLAALKQFEVKAMDSADEHD